MSLQLLFPGASAPLAATWFSGELLARSVGSDRDYLYETRDGKEVTTGLRHKLRRYLFNNGLLQSMSEEEQEAVVGAAQDAVEQQAGPPVPTKDEP